MRIRILGCSGGIGLGLRTTSILVDDNVLIDVGTGVGDLTLAELRDIQHVFLTHSHLDHTAGLPLFLDSIFDHLRERPLQVHARSETIAALRAHMFNDVIWPDFETLPTPEAPVFRFKELAPGDRRQVGERVFQAVNVHHSVPSVGYCIEGDDKVFAFSGDTMTNEELWPVLNSYENLDVLVMEVSFPNSQIELAKIAKHYCPSMLIEDIKNLEHDPEIWVTAMKPGAEDEIFDEVSHGLNGRAIKRLKRGDVIEL